jgi:hypothetical protein
MFPNFNSLILFSEQVIGSETKLNAENTINQNIQYLYFSKSCFSHVVT